MACRYVGHEKCYFKYNMCILQVFRLSKLLMNYSTSWNILELSFAVHIRRLFFLFSHYFCTFSDYSKPIMKQFSSDKRNNVIQMLQTRHSSVKIANKLGMSHATVNNIRKKYLPEQ